MLKSEFIGRASGLSQVPLVRGGEPLGEGCPTVRGRRFCGGTTLWDAVYESVHLELSRYHGSRALLILSDGNDTGSIHPLGQALEEVNRAGVMAYAIRYPDPLSGLAGQGLSQLVAETGGTELPAQGGDYSALLDRIQRDLRSQYVLGFHPEGGGDSKHLLRVEILRPGVAVRSRRQYFLAPNQ